MKQLKNLTKTQKGFLYGIPIAVGLYFIIRQIVGRKTYSTAVATGGTGTGTGGTGTGTGGTGTGGTGTGGTGTGTGGGTTPSGLASYKVTTLISRLNVRSSPSLTASIVGKLNKDQIIKAKPSSTTGWFEYYDGSTLVGYVSADYLTAV